MLNTHEAVIIIDRSLMHTEDHYVSLFGTGCREDNERCYREYQIVVQLNRVDE